MIAQLLVPKPTKEGYDEPSLESPRLFLHALRWLALFQKLRLVPQTPPLRGTFASGSNLLEKRLSLFLTARSTPF
ncbi:hypothetical protein BV494_07485 [Rahnella sikkimica]|uniref:Uncharacterized protein n=1 Tax=Rahnella sikkimica TaxID=1805933 RepID=A0A2L1UPC4_9GAMM|nr:hypothetical protein BV494_07485 [Rahnella sikkimica]